MKWIDGIITTKAEQLSATFRDLRWLDRIIESQVPPEKSIYYRETQQKCYCLKDEPLRFMMEYIQAGKSQRLIEKLLEDWDRETVTELYIKKQRARHWTLDRCSKSRFLVLDDSKSILSTKRGRHKW